ncbi:hypothetical protein KJS94_06645 [Flavihumibacter rivuli]|uniref:hypothetical protein n=1 Tax=Flavihumibacter rivuli TaxID=2838156 RepID=UPI001BDE1B3F|nr:hypothetical protein [Flavihumibacter rivuli]ULQ57875.1 hypothetical protein KJS94_06645 [Flavihumibacter rivuli]
MATIAAIDPAVLRQWMEQKLDIDTIRESLASSGLDESAIEEHIKAFKKARNSRRQFIGFILLSVGGFLGFISTVFSLVNPIPEIFNLVLYGLTSIALIIICAGLYYIFE